MLFNSFAFFIFFGAFLVIYRLLPPSCRKHGLLAASYIFYAFWKVEYVFLLLFSTFLDYFCALRIQQARLGSKQRKTYLLLSICANLGILVFFKYADFLGENMASFAQILGIQASWTTLHLILPLGISFYTFQTLSYTLDVYHQRITPAHSIIDLALYVSFFPQLIAGPIERARDLLPQFDQLHPSFSQEAIFWLTIGFFKKMVVADNLAPFVDKIFNPNHTQTLLEYSLGAYAFAFQIYADFSGYSNIAIGLALLLGVRLQHNFLQPYFAHSFQDFWRRWHRSLSFWLRDYLYFSLGGSQHKKYPFLFTYRNLFITMLLGGLWHGANWTFVVWGVLHGLLLILERPFLHLRIKSPFFRFLKMLWVFHWVIIAFVVFRIESLSQVFNIWQSTRNITVTIFPITGFFFMLVLLLVDVALHKKWLSPISNNSTLVTYWTRYFVLFILFWAILFFGMFQGAQFIYFQF